MINEKADLLRQNELKEVGDDIRWIRLTQEVFNDRSDGCSREGNSKAQKPA